MAQTILNHQDFIIKDELGTAAANVAQTAANMAVAAQTAARRTSEAFDNAGVHSKTRKKFRIKDPGSAITHGIGFLLAAIGAAPIISKAAHTGSTLTTVSITIFIASMMLLYLASTTYHTVDSSEPVNRSLQKFDHMAIYLLIAGTYTPICLVALNNRVGHRLFLFVWGIAILGMIFNLAWISCPKWLSSVLYITLGWAVMFTFKDVIAAIPATAFYWLLAGGIIYTVGGVIYALKLPIFKNLPDSFGNHEIFHCFVCGGSFCHYMMILMFVAGIAA